MKQDGRVVAKWFAVRLLSLWNSRPFREPTGRIRPPKHALSRTKIQRYPLTATGCVRGRRAFDKQPRPLVYRWLFLSEKADRVSPDRTAARWPIPATQMHPPVHNDG